MKKFNVMRSVVGLGFIAAGFAANAASIGGVITPAEITQFDSGNFAQIVTWDKSNDSGSFTGWGEVTGFNNVSYDVVPGGQLTYSVTTDFVTNDVNIPGFTYFTGGVIQFFVDSGTAFNASNQASAEDGTLWMTIQSTPQFLTGEEFEGILTGNLSGAGNAFFNVVLAGLPTDIFDTNTQLINLTGEFADFSWGSSIPANSTTITNVGNVYQYYSTGSGDLVGSAKIPEPATLSLLGLGLLGFSFGRKKSV